MISCSLEFVIENMVAHRLYLYTRLRLAFKTTLSNYLPSAASNTYTSVIELIKKI